MKRLSLITKSMKLMSMKNKDKKTNESLKKEKDFASTSKPIKLGSLTNQISKVMVKLDKLDKDKK